MKTYLAALVIAVAILPATSFSQLGKLKNLVSKGTGSGVSENEAGQGIKEALAKGVTTAVLNLNKTDGFFGSNLYKVLLPPLRLL
jgi:hypothetical protein